MAERTEGRTSRNNKNERGSSSFSRGERSSTRRTNSGSYGSRDGEKKRTFSRDRDGNDRRDFSKNRDGEERRSYTNNRENGEKRSFSRDRNGGERRSFSKNRDGEERRSYSRDRDNGGERRSFSRDRDNGGERKSFSRDRDNGSERKSFSRDRDNGGERRSFSRDRDNGGERRSFSRDRDNGGERKSFSRDRDNGGERRSFSRDRDNGGERRSFSRDRDNGGERRSFSRDRDNGGERRSFSRDRDNDSERRSFSRDRDNGGERRSFNKRRDEDGGKRSFSKGRDRKDKVEEKINKRRDVTAESAILSEIVERRHREGRPSKEKQKVLTLEEQEKYGPIRLNKYIANAGICSRRDADTLIESGAIVVNGNVVTELGTKVNPTDEVRFEDKILQREKPIYLLLNKPKDYVTTTDDELGRKHVIELVRGACTERIYPVGRLDKNTTGLLLFTNDGDMTKKLTHPRHNIQKTYAVELDKNITAADFKMIAEEGVELHDGIMQVDDLAYIGDSKKEIGVTIHSGKNRIVRRIFESLGYEVEKLDRVVFANLTKKDLPRGRWRFLTDAEVNILKMIKVKSLED